MDKSKIKLTDLIDVKTLQKIQDAFASAMGMAALTVDLNGAVTELSNPSDFCMRLTRGCEKGAARCTKCDLQGGEQAARTGRPAVYYCHAGLMDFAAPIFLGDRQVGSMIGGQVLPEPPDEAKFCRIAAEIGVDEAEYLRALGKIRQVPKSGIEAAANLLYVMANALSDVGYQKYRTRALAGELLHVSEDMRDKVRKTSESVRRVTAQNDTLVRHMAQLSDSSARSQAEVEKTNEIVRYIERVSLQTKMLGFNASVEASHAKEYGAGFNIIAGEIQKLAKTTEEQFTKVDAVLRGVRQNMKEMESRMREAEAVLADSTAVLGAVSQEIGEISAHADLLEETGKKL